MVLNVWAHVWWLMRLSMSLRRRQSTMEPTWCRKVQKLQEVMQQKVMVELVWQKVMVELVWLMRMSLTPRFPLNMEIQWEISTCRCMLTHHHRQDTRHPQLRSWWCLMVLAKVTRQPHDGAWWCWQGWQGSPSDAWWCWQGWQGSPSDALMVLARISKGAKAPSVTLDGVSTGSSSSASERSLASTHEKALESNQKGKGCKGKDVERLLQWVTFEGWDVACTSWSWVGCWSFGPHWGKKKEKSSWVYHLVSQDQTMWLLDPTHTCCEINWVSAMWPRTHLRELAMVGFHW